MLGDADRVGIGDLGDGDALVHGGLQIGVVGADAGGDDQLQLLRLVEALLGHVSGPERLGDDDLGVGQLLLELRVRAFLVGGHHQSVAGLLQELAKPKLARHAAKQLAGLEVDGARGRRGLAVGVVGDLGDVVAGIFGGIAVDRVGIENSKYFGHVIELLGLLHAQRKPAASRNSRRSDQRVPLTDRDQAWRFSRRPSSRAFPRPAVLVGDLLSSPGSVSLCLGRRNESRGFTRNDR